MNERPVFDGPPEMRIEVFDEGNGLHICSWMDVVNADNPADTITTFSRRLADLQTVRSDRDRFELAREVYAHAAAHWMHEFDEWFRVDGVRLHEPHETSTVQARPVIANAGRVDEARREHFA